MSSPRLNPDQPDLRPLIVVDVVDEAEPDSVWSAYRKDSKIAYRLINSATTVSIQLRFEKDAGGGPEWFFLGYSGATAKRLEYPSKDHYGLLGDLLAARQLNRLADRIENSSGPVTAIAAALGCEFRSFFDTALDIMTDSAATNNNLAAPTPAMQTLLERNLANAVTEKQGKKKVDFKRLQKGADVWSLIPLTLTFYGLDAGSSGRPAQPWFHFELDLASLPSSVKPRDLARKLIAADWSTLALDGKPSLLFKDEEPKKWLAQLRSNVISYLAGHTRLARGQALLDMVVSAGTKASSPARTVVKAVQGEIDRLVIVANSWNVPTEQKTEGLQYTLYLLFGAMYSETGDKNRVAAHPVFFQRGMLQPAHRGLPGDIDLAASTLKRKKVFPRPYDTQVLVTLAHGLGHCGEHSQVAFIALRQLREREGISAIESAFRVFEGDGDHAFVLVNLEILETVRFTPKSGPHTGREHVFIDLYAQANKIGPSGLPPEGLVLDAYLDASVFAADAALLQEAYELDRKLKHFVLEDALSQTIGTKIITKEDLKGDGYCTPIESPF